MTRRWRPRDKLDLFIATAKFARDMMIFSVYQTDIIHYGGELAEYLENEFGSYFGGSGYKLKKEIKHIEFWSLLVE